MTDKTLSYLDYQRILGIVRDLSSTPYAQDLITNLTPLYDPELIEARLDKVEALVEVIKWDGEVPLRDIPDIAEIIRRASLEDAVLDVREFTTLFAFLISCNSVAAFLKRAHKKLPFIESLLTRIRPLPALSRKIGQTVNPDGFVEDTASYELSRIRAELFSLKERARKRLEKVMEREVVRPVLQDTYISIRNGRYVIPVKPNFNEAFQGIVHDYSHSLKTSFVEPMEIVEVNNTINMLEKEEKEEEKRVLRELTEYLRVLLPDLAGDVEALGELDLFHALARFAVRFNCARPLVGTGEGIEIRRAVNPFILLSRGDQTVPIDIRLDAEKKVMVISGPNAGGKTAALKTAGLLCVMAQTGLFIPSAERPRIPLFPMIFAIIGDEQDISMELSSFTAHMKAINDVYGQVKGRELILVDEIGGNTEPQEASALAMAILDAFVEKGARIIVTTHLNLLKAYGYTRDFATNVATAFDSETMRSRYELVYGMAGYSNAIKVARNMAVPQEIIEKSFGYLGTQEYMLNDLIGGLEADKERVGQELREVRRLKEEVRERVQRLREKKEEYERRLEEKFRERLAGLEEEIEAIRKEIVKRDRPSLRRAREKVEDLKERKGIKGVFQANDIRAGDYVRVRSLGSRGYVATVDREQNTGEVVFGSVRTTVNLSTLEKVLEKPSSGRARELEVHVEPVAGPVINVMGMRAEEALKEVDRFVDRAMVQGLPTVKVLHGIGTGRLMNAVKSHLEKRDFIRSVKRDEGNAGVTIVEFL